MAAVSAALASRRAAAPPQGVGAQPPLVQCRPASRGGILVAGVLQSGCAERRHLAASTGFAAGALALGPATRALRRLRKFGRQRSVSTGRFAQSAPESEGASPQPRRLVLLALRAVSTGLLIVMLLVFAGTMAFKLGLVKESVQIFDAASSLGYPKALLWQRGISLYYDDRFEEGAAQFRKDVELNPDDTEEAIWATACDARRVGLAEARQSMAAIGDDPRPRLREAHALFRGGEGEAEARAALERAAAGPSESDAFYAAFYLGLFAEASGDQPAARAWMQRAVASQYARSSFDYMADVARLHAHVRSWDAA